MKETRVIGRYCDTNGNPSDQYDANPILNTQVYYVMLPDVSIEKYYANLIAVNLCIQENEEGHRYNMIDDIVDRCKLESYSDKDDGYVISSSGIMKRKLTKKGWELIFNRRDENQSWFPFKDIKDYNPI